MARIDEVNLRVLQLLQKNGRMSLSDLAAAVGRSESSVRERVSALEMDGFLSGYQARVDWSRVGLPAHAVIRARCDPARLPQLAAKLQKTPHVTNAMFLTGPKPILIMLRVRDVAHLHSILREELAQGDLQDLEAVLALESIVDQRPPQIVMAPAGQDLLTGPGATGVQPAVASALQAR